MKPKLAVTVPTRNRPDKLDACLQALKEARKFIEFPVYVCDSSPNAAAQNATAAVCRKFPFVTLHRHSGKNVSASKNFCASVAAEPLLLNVDDDVNVEPQAVKRLYDRFLATRTWAVVCGSVFWGASWDGPFVLRPIGYGRPPKVGEAPSFLLGAFFLYPKVLAEVLPWNDRVAAAEDIFMGALWRSHDISLVCEPEAKAVHNRTAPEYGLEFVGGQIYTNLFDALIANRNLVRAASYEFLGFAANVKRYFKSLGTMRRFLVAWYSGHSCLFRDWQYLISLTEKQLPAYAWWQKQLSVTEHPALQAEHVSELARA